MNFHLMKRDENIAQYRAELAKPIQEFGGELKAVQTHLQDRDAVFKSMIEKQEQGAKEAWGMFDKLTKLIEGLDKEAPRTKAPRTEEEMPPDVPDINWSSLPSFAGRAGQAVG